MTIGSSGATPKTAMSARFLRLFTDLPMDEIARLEKLQGAELNDAKKILATEATAILHGREAADSAAETARRAFEEGAIGGRPAHHHRQTCRTAFSIWPWRRAWRRPIPKPAN